MTAGQIAPRPRTDPNVLIATFVANTLGLALPIIMIQVYDRIIPNGAYETMTVLACALAAAALADFAVRLARGHLIARAAARFEEAAHERAFARLVSESSGEIDRLAKGDLLDRLGAIERVRKHYGNDGTTALVDIPFIALFVATMAFISPVLGAAILVFAVSALAVVWSCRGAVIRLGEERKERDRRRHSFLAETIETIEMIKSSGIEDVLERRYEKLMSGSAAITRDLTRRANFVQGVVMTIGLIAPVAMAGVGSYLMLRGEITMGALAAAVLLTGRVIQPTLRIEALWAGDHEIRSSVRDVAFLCGSDTLPRGRAALPEVHTLALDAITWQPDKGRPPVLQSVSLDLRRGDCLLVTGADGSGRSSLLSVMAGLVTPDAGAVVINGMPIHDFHPQDLARRVCLLSAENTLLEGSVLDNLTGFDPDRYLDASQALAHAFGIDTFFQRHPEGMLMDVSALGGTALPRSIHDSIVLISGLVSAPDVILFDEANAGLDRVTDARLLALLTARSHDCIMVLATNRPSYQALANRRIHLSRGALDEAEQPHRRPVEEPA